MALVDERGQRMQENLGWQLSCKGLGTRVGRGVSESDQVSCRVVESEAEPGADGLEHLSHTSR